MPLRKGALTLRLEERGEMKRNRGPKRGFIRSAIRWANGTRRTRDRSSGIFSTLGLIRGKAFEFSRSRIGRRPTSGSTSRRKIFPSFLFISRKNAKSSRSEEHTSELQS